MERRICDDASTRGALRAGTARAPVAIPGGSGEIISENWSTAESIARMPHFLDATGPERKKPPAWRAEVESHLPESLTGADKIFRPPQKYFYSD
jgi:hypothetical protein